MNDREEYKRIADALASARLKLAEIEGMDADDLRHALKEHMRRADVYSGTIAQVDELRDDAVLQQVSDYRRNAIADLEIKLAQITSRLGGQPPQPGTEKQGNEQPQQ